ncbi:hypothetical protein V6N13_143108 [Hibiscus sabdariffa]|uniref:Uncharacterized protein n=1 Tax=Hibiscus sabdariffa TaxID=183260 RepID=A0ABR2FGH1_9ROSI
MRSKGHSQKFYNKFVRGLKAPFQALRKARDGYIRILTSCDSSIDYGYCPSHFPRQNHELPRSYSERSSATSNVKEEAVLTELARAASVPSSSHGNEMDVFSPKQLRAKMRSRVLPKNMGRIDEDKPCEFEDNNVVIVERRRKVGIKFRHQESLPVYGARA